jgi:putative PIN family toxin of toxin-antitoxin system
MDHPLAVVDTNVLVSALLKPNGLESEVVRLFAMRQFTLCFSATIFEEYTEVLSRPKFDQIHPDRIARLLMLVRNEAKQVHPTLRLTVCPDEPDNRFLECAEAASADFLVTGNKRHFPAAWISTRIVNAREFLQRVRR